MGRETTGGWTASGAESDELLERPMRKLCTVCCRCCMTHTVTNPLGDELLVRMSKRAKGMVGGKKNVSRPQKEMCFLRHTINSRIYFCGASSKIKGWWGRRTPLHTEKRPLLSRRCRQNGHLLLKVGVRYY